MSRAAYLQTWRAAYPHKVKEYSARARRKAGMAPRPVPLPPPEPTPAERKRAYDREYHRAHRAVPAPNPLDEVCAHCHLGPCKGVCDGY